MGGNKLSRCKEPLPSYWLDGMAGGRRGHCWAGGAGHECLCRPYREQELHFQGHWVALQDFKQKSHLLMFFRNILLAVIIIDLAGG